MTGSIVTFDDAIPFMPIESIVARIEPVQDLHGQDAPYPPGGGKNKANFDNIQIGKAWNAGNNSERATLFIPALPSTEYTVSVTGFTGLTLTYVEKEDAASTSNNYLTAFTSGIYTRTTAATTGCIAIQFAKTGGISAADLANVKLQLELGSTATSYAPYSNVCPISGWTGLEGKRTGKNLLDSAGFTHGVLGWNEATADNVGAQSYYITSKYIPVSGLGTITVSATKGKIVRYYETDKYHKTLYFSGTTIAEGNSQTFTLHSGCAYVRLSIGTGSKTVVTPSDYGTIIYGQIEQSSTASDYEPFSGESISVSWQDTAGTVFGGTMTVNEDGSGELVSARAKKIFDGTEALSYNRESATSGYAIYRLGAKNAVAIFASGLSNILKPVTSGLATADWAQMVQNSGAFNQDQIAFRFTSDFDGGTASGTVTNYKAELARLYSDGTPLEVCYELATPQTYHFDNLEQLTTLIGTNNIWVDTGDVTVTYQSTTSRSEYIVGMIGRAIEVFDENTELPENTSDVLDKTIDVFDEHEVEKIDNPLLKNTIELYDPKEIDESEKPYDTFNDTVDIFD